MRILLLTPPMTQLNTPYPATAYLTGFLRKHAPHIEVVQADPGLKLFLRMCCRDGVGRMLSILRARAKSLGKSAQAQAPRSIAHFLFAGDRVVDAVDAVLRFLQGRDPGLALRIAGRTFLPEGPRFSALAQGPGGGDEDETLGWAFGALGTQDRAKYLASLFIDDLADVIRDGIDPHFQLSRYGESLALSAPSFDPLAQALDAEPTLLDGFLDDIGEDLLKIHRPDVVGMTAPFPGNVYGAFRLARAMKRAAPHIRTILGGGYVNTELRDLREPRVFDSFDFVTLDDGERPLLALLAHLEDPSAPLFRTFVREGQQVLLKTNTDMHDIPHRDTGTPTYDGLDLTAYPSFLELLNPMHRLWSDGRWNKLTIAHGCYWKKCTFCDVSLDYIGRYDGAPADLLVDRIESLIAETGQTGFHFVDEAAPPAVLRALAERLIARKVVITWWGNIRFEKTFTPELTTLLAQSGCVAISGGLEVASDRLLQLMKKGVTVEQVARVTHAFTDAGVMVHAYLMYGFPTQTQQETIDSLERVRQLFETGCLQSAFWHRFAATAHSPIGLSPDQFGIQLQRGPRPTFARNELGFSDPTGCDHERLGIGLRKALYNYMHGLGLDVDVRSWFDGMKKSGKGAVPAAQVPHDLIEKALQT